VTATIEFQEFGEGALVALFVLSLDDATVATAVDGERAVRRYPTVLQAVASFNESAAGLAARFGCEPVPLDPFAIVLAPATGRTSAAPGPGRR
jgi:hypothetical protein